MTKQKYIFVTGGVLSGVGKGITAASIGAVLQAKGATVSIQKCDPYLNVDAGLLDPSEHGEVFVTKDGAETDLDLGHYERFLDVELTNRNTTLSGKLFQELIEKERSGGFGGKTVQLVPHLTDLIQKKIRMSGEGSDVHIVEIGGTVGDYEGLSFIEAIRELSWKVGRENCLFVHVVYVPFIETSGEFKTKPAQNAMRDLRNFGIMPDAVIARSESKTPQSIAKKIALFGGLDSRHVQLVPNVDTVFRVPMIIANNGVHDLLSQFSGFHSEPDMQRWQTVLDLQTKASKAATVTIGVVSEEASNRDTYLSLVEALKAAAFATSLNLNIKAINTDSIDGQINSVDGLIIPDGIGGDGLEQKIESAQFALKNDLPFLGIGLGMQAAAVAAAHLGGANASTAEFVSDDLDQAIVSTNQLVIGQKTINLMPDSLVSKFYQTDKVSERVRHRSEVSSDFVDAIEKAGVEISGRTSEGTIEFIEAKKHRFFVGSQPHIEFKSRPFRPHPIIEAFLKSI